MPSGPESPFAEWEAPGNRAPPRGCYDRARPRRERQQEQRRRLLASTATERWRHGAGLNVSHVIEAAGVSRRTFYEFFDDLAHALEQVQAWAIDALGSRLDRAMASEPTPMNRLVAMLTAWFAFARESPDAVAVALARADGPPAALSAAGQLVAERLASLASEARRTGAFAGAETDRLLVAAAALEALAARVATGTLTLDAAVTSARDAVVRLLH